MGDIFLGFLFICALCVLPIFFWEKAKRNEYCGLWCVSIVFGEAFTFLTRKNFDLIDYVLNAAAYSCAAIFVLLLVLVIVKMAISEGKKEFYKAKKYYLSLKEKSFDELTTLEQKRLMYFEKQHVEEEFKPKRIMEELD